MSNASESRVTAFQALFINMFSFIKSNTRHLIDSQSKVMNTSLLHLNLKGTQIRLRDEGASNPRFLMFCIKFFWKCFYAAHWISFYFKHQIASTFVIDFLVIFCNILRCIFIPLIKVPLSQHLDKILLKIDLLHRDEKNATMMEKWSSLNLPTFWSACWLKNWWKA